MRYVAMDLMTRHLKLFNLQEVNYEHKSQNCICG